MLALLALACTPAERPARLLVMAQEDGEYGLVARAVPELTDPHRMVGSLGQGFRGGAFQIDLFAEEVAMTYREGGPIEVGYGVEDGLGVPIDEDGLVLWSYYNTLSEVSAELGEHGHDVSPIFPIDFAFQPVSVQFDFTGGENAAYAGSGLHLFILLPDVLRGVVPLGANPGVIRHEFGHAFFHLLTVGDPYEAAPYDDVEAGFTAVRALNEGFADMVATLTLDDPAFIELSLPTMTSRDVTGDWQATADLYPEGAASFDPYALGTVYASLAWDLREATGDPWLTLGAAIDALGAWAAEEAWADTDRWAELLVERAADLGAESELCAAFTQRFPTRTPPEQCP